MLVLDAKAKKTLAGKKDGLDLPCRPAYVTDCGATFYVTSTLGKYQYFVSIVKEAGTVAVECNCEGHAQGFVCRHVRRAMAELKTILLANQALMTFCGCGNLKFQDQGLCTECASAGSGRRRN